MRKTVPREFGGCLPRETHLLNSPNPLPGAQTTLQFNSGRSAIYAAVVASGARRVWLPRYTCPTISEFLTMRGVRVSEYSIDRNFLPMLESWDDGDVVVWTNYYGCMPGKTIQTVKERFGEKLIIDECQAGTIPAIHGVYNVYSLRKEFGVPDGSLLVSTLLDRLDLTFYKNIPETCGDDTFLKIASEQGSNAAYSAYLKNEELFKENFGKMSKQTASLVEQIDFPTIVKRRKENFDVLHKELGKLNELDVDFDGRYAFMYPFYIQNDNLRSGLLKKNVFCPTWWKRVIVSVETTEFEKRLSRYLIPLPIDQRYDAEDMFYLANLVKETLR